MAREHDPSEVESSPGLPAEVVLIRARREMILPKMSRAKAAELAEMSEATWRNVENGKYEGQPDKIATMARVVGVTPEELEEAGRRDAAAMLRTYLHKRAGDEPTLAALDAGATSEALLQLILRGLDDIRSAPSLSDDQKRSLEASLIRSVMQNVSGQLDQIRTALRIAGENARQSR